MFILTAVLALCVCFQLAWFFRRFIQLKNQLIITQQRAQNESDRCQKLTTELTELKNNFDHFMLHDPVTNLPGRKIYEDRVLQTLNQCKRHQLVFAILSFDIDEFKIINNVLGSDVGNSLLREVAARLETGIRQVDTLSRFGDDGFMFLLPQITKAETAAYIAQRLLDSLAEPFYIAGQKLFITASIGISVYPTDGDDVGSMLKNSDIALQQAKANGHNTYQFYHRELFTSTFRELTLNSSLRSDLVYKEFVIYYQPQLNIENKEIHCMEALLRWQHPELGLVPPRDFLRLAENNNRIIEIGEWVLRNACLQLKSWQASGFSPKRVAINVSMRQLENPHFSYKVSQILQETGVDPSSIVLEISESILFPKLNFIEKTLHIIKHLGVQIAIDDFGTGNLSLANLRRFSVNYLKIDNSLVQSLTQDKENIAIVKMMVGLANHLQLVTVAEGVESIEQKELLKEMGCFLMQGHLFSVPRLPEEFTNRVVKSISEHS